MTTATKVLIPGITAACLVFVLDLFSPVPLAVTTIQGSPRLEGRVLRPGSLLGGEWVETGHGGTLDVKLGDYWGVQVKPDSRVRLSGAPFVSRKRVYHGELAAGTLLAAADRFLPLEEVLEIQAGQARVRGEGAVFALSVKGEGESLFHLLRGKATVTLNDGSVQDVGPMQTVSWTRDSKRAVVTGLDLQNWTWVSAAYSVVPEEAGHAWEQRDLARQSGNLFSTVYFLGSFFTEKISHVESRFVREAGDLRLDIYYDMAVPHSFAGSYAQLHGFPLEDYSGFSMQARRQEGCPAPEEFRVEFKKGPRILSEFDFAGPSGKGWETLRGVIHPQAAAEITEVVILFRYEKVSTGTGKQGCLQLKDFHLEPRSGEVS